jgi:hypothetical protein
VLHGLSLEFLGCEIKKIFALFFSLFCQHFSKIDNSEKLQQMLKDLEW